MLIILISRGSAGGGGARLALIARFICPHTLVLKAQLNSCEDLAKYQGKKYFIRGEMNKANEREKERESSSKVSLTIPNRSLSP